MTLQTQPEQKQGELEPPVEVEAARPNEGSLLMARVRSKIQFNLTHKSTLRRMSMAVRLQVGHCWRWAAV